MSWSHLSCVQTFPPLLLLHMYGDLECCACNKTFSTLKHLSAHEAVCKAKKQLALDAILTQKRISKARQKLLKKGSLSWHSSLGQATQDAYTSHLPHPQFAQRYSSDLFNNEIALVHLLSHHTILAVHLFL